MLLSWWKIRNCFDDLVLGSRWHISIVKSLSDVFCSSWFKRCVFLRSGIVNESFGNDCSLLVFWNLGKGINEFLLLGRWEVCYCIKDFFLGSRGNISIFKGLGNVLSSSWWKGF